MTVPTECRGQYAPFQIHGELYHSHGLLVAANGVDPVYAQVYIYDVAYQTQLRKKKNFALAEPLLNKLTYLMDYYNPYIPLYKTAAELLASAEVRSTPVLVILLPEIRLVMEEGSDRRRYNLPTSDKVAAIIPD
ncbi:hypothetical protein BJX76DRAFT_363247 [Aspergillus varians]